MSIKCEKCGADISFEDEEHPNCNTVVHLRIALNEALERLEHWVPIDHSWRAAAVHERISELRKKYLEE